MKKISIKVACLLMASTILCTSCIGSFKTFNKLSSWNQELTGSKFVNELVFICFHIIPIYEVAYLGDVLIFNSIEFWTGNNPIAKAGEVKRMKGSNGDMFAITTTKNGYKIVDETRGCECQLVFDKKAKTWNAVLDGATYLLMSVNEDGSLTLNFGDQKITATPDAAGVDMAMQAASASQIFLVD